MWYNIKSQITNLDNVEYIEVKENKMLIHYLSRTITEISYDNNEIALNELKHICNEIKKEGN